MEQPPRVVRRSSFGGSAVPFVVDIEDGMEEILNADGASACGFSPQAQRPVFSPATATATFVQSAAPLALSAAATLPVAAPPLSVFAPPSTTGASSSLCSPSRPSVVASVSSGSFRRAADVASWRSPSVQRIAPPQWWNSQNGSSVLAASALAQADGSGSGSGVFTSQNSRPTDAEQLAAGAASLASASGSGVFGASFSSGAFLQSPQISIRTIAGGSSGGGGGGTPTDSRLRGAGLARFPPAPHMSLAALDANASAASASEQNSFQAAASGDASGSAVEASDEVGAVDDCEAVDFDAEEFTRDRWNRFVAPGLEDGYREFALRDTRVLIAAAVAIGALSVMQPFTVYDARIFETPPWRYVSGDPQRAPWIQRHMVIGWIHLACGACLFLLAGIHLALRLLEHRMKVSISTIEFLNWSVLLFMQFSTFASDNWNAFLYCNQGFLSVDLELSDHRKCPDYFEPYVFMVGMLGFVVALRSQFLVPHYFFLACVYFVSRYAFEATFRIRDAVFPFIHFGLLVLMVSIEQLNRRWYLSHVVLQRSGDAAKCSRDSLNLLMVSLLPPSATKRLIAGGGVADSSTEATTVFADVVDFTAWCSARTSHDVVAMLNDMYRAFDSALTTFKVTKVKTIGDAYWAVSGIPEPTPDHASEICSFALWMMQCVQERVQPDWPNITIRVGVHSGPVAGGIIGENVVSYEVFGEASENAERVEQAAMANCVVISEDTLLCLRRRGFSPSVTAAGEFSAARIPTITPGLSGRVPSVTNIIAQLAEAASSGAAVSSSGVFVGSTSSFAGGSPTGNVVGRDGVSPILGSSSSASMAETRILLFQLHALEDRASPAPSSGTTSLPVVTGNVLAGRPASVVEGETVPLSPVSSSGSRGSSNKLLSSAVRSGPNRVTMIVPSGAAASEAEWEMAAVSTAASALASRAPLPAPREEPAVTFGVAASPDAQARPLVSVVPEGSDPSKRNGSEVEDPAAAEALAMAGLEGKLVSKAAPKSSGPAVEEAMRALEERRFRFGLLTFARADVEAGYRAQSVVEFLALTQRVDTFLFFVWSLVVLTTLLEDRPHPWWTWALRSFAPFLHLALVLAASAHVAIPALVLFLSLYVSFACTLLGTVFMNDSVARNEVIYIFVIYAAAATARGSPGVPFLANSLVNAAFILGPFPPIEFHLNGTMYFHQTFLPVTLCATWLVAFWRFEKSSRSHYVEKSVATIALQASIAEEARFGALLERVVPPFIIPELLGWFHGGKVGHIASTIPDVAVMFLRVRNLVSMRMLGHPRELLSRAAVLACEIDAMMQVYPSCLKLKTVGDIFMFACGLVPGSPPTLGVLGPNGVGLPDNNAAAGGGVDAGGIWGPPVSPLRASPPVGGAFGGRGESGGSGAARRNVTTMLDFAMMVLTRSTPGAVVMGIHVGTVTAGVIGTDRLIYDVFGDTVNVASRVMSTSFFEGGVWLSESAARIYEEGEEAARGVAAPDVGVAGSPSGANSRSSWDEAPEDISLARSQSGASSASMLATLIVMLPAVKRQVKGKGVFAVCRAVLM